MFTNISRLQLLVLAILVITSIRVFAISGFTEGDGPVPQTFEDKSSDENFGILPGNPHPESPVVYTPGNPTVHADALNRPIFRNTSQVHATLVLIEKGVPIERYMKGISDDFTGYPFHIYDLNEYEKRAIQEKGFASLAVELLLNDFANILRESKTHVHLAIEIPEKLAANDTKQQLTHLRDVLADRRFQVGSEDFSLRETDVFIFARASDELDLTALSGLQGPASRNLIHSYLLSHDYPEELLNSVAGYSTYYKNDCSQVLDNEEDQAPKK
jgi:hypothetical protein